MTLKGGISCSIVLMALKVICFKYKDVGSELGLMIHGNMYNFAHRREGKVYTTNSNVDLVAKPSLGHLTVWSPFRMPE
jgi:hypothetical protein